MTHEYQDKLFFAVFRRGITKLFFPTPLRTALSVIRSAKYIGAGLRCLLHGKIQVPVLDATAITVSMLRGDFETAGSIMFLLGIGDIPCPGRRGAPRRLHHSRHGWDDPA